MKFEDLDKTQVFAAEYDPETGRILSLMSVPRYSVGIMRDEQERYIIESTDHINLNNDWVQGEQIVLRPEIPAPSKLVIDADGTDIATIDLPEPMTVYIDDQPYDLSGQVEIASDMPAIYRVRIDHFPYRLYEAEIVAQ